KILSAPPSSLSVRDAAIAQYFGNQLKEKEAAIYDRAIAERNKEKTLGCNYSLDADIANELEIPLFNPDCHTYAYSGKFIQEPTKDYFLAVGYKSVYGEIVDPGGVARAQALISRQVTTVAIATTAVTAGFVAGVLTNAAILINFQA